MSCREVCSDPEDISMSFKAVLMTLILAGAQQPPAVQQVPRSPAVDAAAHDRGTGAVGRPLPRVPRHTGARRRQRWSEYHPDEDRQLRSLVVHARQRARAVPQEGASDAERQGQRELYRRRDRGPRALPAPEGQRHDALVAALHGHRHPGWRREGGRSVFQRRRRLRHLSQRHGQQPRRHSRARHHDRRSAAADALSDAWPRPRQPVCRDGHRHAGVRARRCLARWSSGAIST